MSALTNLGTDVPTTMTSREIGELIGKRHHYILRDVKKLLADLGQTSPKFWG